MQARLLPHHPPAVGSEEGRHLLNAEEEERPLHPEVDSDAVRVHLLLLLLRRSLPLLRLRRRHQVVCHAVDLVVRVGVQGVLDQGLRLLVVAAEAVCILSLSHTHTHTLYF